MISYLEPRNEKLNAEFALPLKDLAIYRENSLVFFFKKKELKEKKHENASKVKGK